MPLRARRAGSGGWGMAVGDPTNECGRGNGGRGDCSALEGFKVSAELCIKYTYNKKGKGVVARLRGCSEDGREEGQKLWAGGSAPPGVSPFPPQILEEPHSCARSTVPPPKKKEKKEKGSPSGGHTPPALVLAAVGVMGLPPPSSFLPLPAAAPPVPALPRRGVLACPRRGQRGVGAVGGGEGGV